VGHIAHIPQFGRIYLGELLVTRSYVQLIALRAELGSVVNGQVTAGAVGGGGSDDDDP
jgi:hypothetical protein